jgi:hypothetical protein
MSALHHINEFWIHFFQKMKNFLFGNASKEFFVFLFFLLIAFIFWVVRVLDDDYAIDLPVKVCLVNVPNDVIITRDLPPTFTIRVRDKGTVLLGYKMGDGLPPVSIDFNKYKDESDRRAVIQTADVERAYLSQFNPTTKLIAVKPEQLIFVYSRGENKSIPVRIRGSIRPAWQYYISDTIISPATVKVYAPPALLKRVTCAYTLPLQKKDVGGNVVYRVGLQPVDGVKFVPSYINVAFRTDIYSEKSFVVNIQGAHFPDNKRLVTFPSKATVSFQIASSLLGRIKESDFSIEIPYEEIANYPKDKYPLHVTKQPDGVRNIRISPKNVDFLIEENSNNGN